MASLSDAEIEAVLSANEPRFRWKKNSTEHGFEIDVFTVGDESELVANISVLHGEPEENQAEALLNEMSPEQVDAIKAVTSIHSLHVAKEWRNQGVASYIYNLALREIKKVYPSELVLVLASPMDEENGGMDLATLIDFYSKAGFKELYYSDSNNEALLWLESPSKIKTISQVVEAAKESRFHWKKKDTGDGFEIDVFDVKNDELVGNITVVNEYVGDEDDVENSFFMPYKDEPFIHKLMKHENVTDIRSLNVEENYRGQGVGKYIYNLALQEIKKRYPDAPVFINASPHGDTDMALDDLIEFYTRAGFKVLKRYDQHRNATLWMEDPAKLKTVAAEEPRFRWKKSTLNNGFDIHVYPVDDPEQEIASIEISRRDPSEDEEDTVGWMPGQVSDVTMIDQLEVKPDFRGQGVAKYILNLALAEIKKIYANDPILLYANPLDSDTDFHALLSFYARAGFKKAYEYSEGEEDSRTEILLYMNSPKEMKAVAAEEAEAAIEFKNGIEYAVDEVVRLMREVDTPGPHQDRCERYIRNYNLYILKTIDPMTTDIPYKDLGSPESKELLDKYENLHGEPPPIIVHPEEDGTYRVIDGQHRTEIARRRMKDLKALVGVPSSKVKEAKKTEAAIGHYYHGTSSAVAEKILKEGFDPSPEKRVWDESSNLESFAGTYFSTNFMTALSSTRRAVEKLGGVPAIFEVELEKSHGLFDEDEFPSPLGAMDKSSGFLINDYYAKIYKDDPNEAVQEYVKKAADYYLDTDLPMSLFYKEDFFNFSKAERERLHPLVVEWVWAEIDQIARYGRNEQKKVPAFRKALDQLVQALRGMPDVVERRNIRMLGDVGKIISLTYFPNYQKHETDEPYILKPIYGEPSADLLKQFDESIGGKRVLGDEHAWTADNPNSPQVMPYNAHPMEDPFLLSAGVYKTLKFKNFDVETARKSEHSDYFDVDVYGPGRILIGNLQVIPLMVEPGPNDDPNHLVESPEAAKVWDVWVKENFRRQGIATEMYRIAKQELGKELAGGDVQTPEGQELRKAIGGNGAFDFFESKPPYDGLHPMDDPNVDVGSPSTRNTEPWEAHPLGELRDDVALGAVQFKNAVQSWNGKSPLKSGMNLDGKVYLLDDTPLAWVQKNLNIPEPELAAKIGNADTKELPEDFFRIYRPMIVEDLKFTLYDMTHVEDFQDFVLKVLLQRKPLPPEFSFKTLRPAKEKTLLTTDFMKKGKLSLAASDKVTLKEFIKVVTKVARLNKFGEPEKSYWQCTNFSEAVYKMAMELGLPCELWNVRIVFKKDLGEIRQGERVGHDFLKLGDKFYDFTARQADPNVPFPYIASKPYRGAKKKEVTERTLRWADEFFFKQLWDEFHGEDVESAVEAGLSPVLFHLTSLQKAAAILKENQFKLVNDRGTQSDQGKGREEWFYLSTSRSLANRYQWYGMGAQAVMLVLDGQKLGQNYSGGPVDYWQAGPAQQEAEDRVWSHEHTIPDASNYIKEIHTNLPEPEQHGFEQWANWREALRGLLVEAKKNQIPIFVYKDESAFRLLDKRKAMPLAEFQDRLKGGEELEAFPRGRRDYFKPWKELLQKPVDQPVSPDAYRLLDTITGSWKKEAITKLNNEIHNARSKHDPDMVAFLGLMKGLDLDTTEAVVEYLNTKWKDVQYTKIKSEHVESELKVDHHTVMLNAEDCEPNDVAAQFQEVSGMIPQDAVFEDHPYKTDQDGREMEPHITVLYGLTNAEDMAAISAKCAEIPPIEFTIGEVSAFRNDDKPYDVLKIAIDSPEMEKLHYWIRDNFENKCTFPFSGHMTLAYIKKGTCADLEGPCEWTGQKYIGKQLVFSHKEDGLSTIPLKVEAAKNTITVFRGVTDVPPDQIDHRFYGEGVWGRATYFALEKDTARAYALGESDSHRDFGIVGEYAISTDKVVTLTEDDYIGIESAMDLKATEEGAKRFKGKLPKKINPSKLPTLIKRAGWEGFILEESSEGSMPEGNEQLILPVDSKLQPKLLRFDIYAEKDLLDKIGIGEDNYGISLNGIPASKAKEVSKRLRKALGVAASEFEDEGHVNGHWGSQASGVMFRCNGKILLLKRAHWTMDPLVWGIPGGAVPVSENGEPMDPKESARKEVGEEIGGFPAGTWGGTFVYQANDGSGFKYTTFVMDVDEEFDPVLNDEHTAFVWVEPTNLPSDVHHGVEWVVKQMDSEPVQASVLGDRTKQMSQEDMEFLEFPDRAYDRLKEAFMLEVIYHQAPELKKRAILNRYKRLNMDEMFEYLHPAIYEHAWMQKGKGGEAITLLEKNYQQGMEKEVPALSLALNVLHHHGRVAVDYAGFLSDAQLDELSNIPQEEIASFKTKIGAEAEQTSFLPDDLVMVDLEMTGVKPKRDKILQVAMLKLKLQNGQYVEYDEPLELFMQFDGQPENDFQKKYLSHIFERCNQSNLQPGEAKEAICEWLGELKGKVQPTGECVPTDIHFLKEHELIDESDIGDDGPLPGTFHYEFFEMNPLKAVARHKRGEKYATSGIDEENIHDALVDCRNQLKELNDALAILLPEHVVKAAVEVDPKKAFEEFAKIEHQREYKNLDRFNVEDAEERLGLTRSPKEFEKYTWTREPFPLSKPTVHGNPLSEPMWSEGYNKPREPWDTEKYAEIENKRNRTPEEEKYSQGWADEAQARQYAKLTTKAPPVFIVWDEKDQRYRFWNGRHRSRAAYLRGDSTIDAFVGHPIEKVESAYHQSYVNYDGATFEVFKNPSRKEVQECKEHDEIRAFLVGPDMYCWSPLKALHQEAASLIKVPKDAISLVVGIHTDGKAYWATVTDWTERGPWNHNPKVKQAVLDNPAFKLIRDRKEFDVHYHDEAIVGDWSEMGEEVSAITYPLDAPLEPIRVIGIIGRPRVRRSLAADAIDPSELPPEVQPIVVDDGVLPEEKKEVVITFNKKALRADSFQDFQQLLDQVMLEAQLTENFRPSVAGVLNEHRIHEGYIAL